MKAARAYGVALLVVGGAFLVRLALDPVIGDRSPFPTFYVAVAFAAWYGGLGPAAVALLLAYLVGDWFFVPPRHELSILRGQPDDLVGAALYLSVAGTFVLLAEVQRGAERRAATRLAEVAREATLRRRAAVS